MTDLCSKEVPVIEVDVSIGGARVCRILDRLFLTRPLPETLILDNVLHLEVKTAELAHLSCAALGAAN